MQNELIIEKFGYNKEKTEENNTLNVLKRIGNDSLFYFAICLSVLSFFQLLPFFVGLLNEFNIGINEVVVSLIGFANVFFYKVFYKLLLKKGY